MFGVGQQRRSVPFEPFWLFLLFCCLHLKRGDVEETGICLLLLNAAVCCCCCCCWPAAGCCCCCCCFVYRRGLSVPGTLLPARRRHLQQDYVVVYSSYPHKKRFFYSLLLKNKNKSPDAILNFSAVTTVTAGVLGGSEEIDLWKLLRARSLRVLVERTHQLHIAISS